VNQDQLKYDDLRAKRADLARAIAAAEEIQETDRTAAGVAVAECGEAPAAWVETSGRRERELAAMRIGLAQFDESARLAMCASQLRVARIVGKRQGPAERQLAELKTRRASLLASAAKAVAPGVVAAGEPPATFLKEFVALEAELALIRAELAEIGAAIAEVQVTS